MRVTRQATRHNLIASAMAVVSEYLALSIESLRANVDRLNDLFDEQHTRVLHFFRLGQYGDDHPLLLGYWRMVHDYYNDLLDRLTMPQQAIAEQALNTAHVGSGVSAIVARVTGRGRT